jgi:hypothetical protein
MRRARTQHSFVYPVTSHEGTVMWYLIHQGQVRAAFPAPENAAAKADAAERIEALYHRHGGARLWPNEETDGLLLVAGWFRRHSEERGRAISAVQAHAACLR